MPPAYVDVRTTFETKSTCKTTNSQHQCRIDIVSMSSFRTGSLLAQPAATHSPEAALAAGGPADLGVEAEGAEGVALDARVKVVHTACNNTNNTNKTIRERTTSVQHVFLQRAQRHVTWSGMEGRLFSA